MEEIRWVYRFNNFERALILLREALEIEETSDLEKEGMVQRFEYTYELAWKTINDYMKYEGISISTETPRQVIKKAFEVGIIKEGEKWMNMIEDRNKSSHTYAGRIFEIITKNIKEEYHSLFEDLYIWLKKQTI